MKPASLPIQSALGIQTGDMLNTSYNSGPYLVHSIHGPFTYFENSGSLVIIDHAEISLSLTIPGAIRKGPSDYINNIRQVDHRWFTAQNAEIFITRHEKPATQAASLFDIFDPPGTVEVLPIPPLYQLNPKVNYKAGPRRAWHCESCHADFNAVPTNKYYYKHDCGSDRVALQIFYVVAPAPDDRRPYFGYYVMTLNSLLYGPVPDYKTPRTPSTTAATIAQNATA